MIHFIVDLSAERGGGSSKKSGRRREVHTAVASSRFCTPDNDRLGGVLYPIPIPHPLGATHGQFAGRGRRGQPTPDEFQVRCLDGLRLEPVGTDPQETLFKTGSRRISRS